MLTLIQAQELIAKAISPVAMNDNESIPLHDAAGRFLAAEIRALVDHPAFANSAMDGYALNSKQLGEAKKGIVVSGEARCGEWPEDLQPHTTMRIFTGAPLPAGADTIAIQEETQTLDEQTIRLTTSPQQGDYVRRQGEDFQAGEILYRLGARLRACDLSVLAAAGIREVDVFRRPRVLLYANGDELASPGTSLKHGQTYEANSAALHAQLRGLGADVEDAGMISDQRDALISLFRAAAHYDFIIGSGGMSVGDHDHVKAAAEQFGEINLWRVRIKPGKPIAFGRLHKQGHFFGLPGNPVSSLVTFALFIRPALYGWHHSQYQPLLLSLPACNPYRRTPGREEFLRARLRRDEGVLGVEVLHNQGSHQIGTLRKTDALVRLPAGQADFATGDMLEVLLFDATML